MKVLNLSTWQVQTFSKDSLCRPSSSCFTRTRRWRNCRATRTLRCTWPWNIARPWRCYCLRPGDGDMDPHGSTWICQGLPWSTEDQNLQNHWRTIRNHQVLEPFCNLLNLQNRICSPCGVGGALACSLRALHEVCDECGFTRPEWPEPISCGSHCFNACSHLHY